MQLLIARYYLTYLYNMEVYNVYFSYFEASVKF